MLKKKNVQVIIGVVLLLVIGLGGYFVVAGSKAKTVEDPAADANIVQSLSPQDIGLTMEASPDKKRVKFNIEKASDIKAVEYELTYEADSTKQEISDGGEKRVQRGITGEASINGKSSYSSEFLVLGSESANTVRYDTGVKSVSITLKVTKTNSKIYQVQDKINL